MNSEKLKVLLDTFGRLSFMLETYVKLEQTGDHAGIKNLVLEAVSDDVQKLSTNIADIQNEQA